jgi:hypothetical protein
VDLVDLTHLRPAEVRAVMNGLWAAALARPLNAAQGTWELSHDFVARAVVRYLGRRRANWPSRILAFSAPVLLALTAAAFLGTIAWNASTPGELDQIIREVHADAKQSPKVALQNLSNALENKSRDILAETNWGQGKLDIPLDHALEQLNNLGQLPPSTNSIFNQFSDVKRRAVSGAYLVSDNEITAALDSGIGILKQLYAIQTEKNIVYNPAVAVYSDPNCKIELTDLRAVILETTSPGGSSTSLRIFPTTRIDYKIGEIVSWEWNMNKIWGPAWYRDPVDHQIRQAWFQSAEFAGKRLSHLPERATADQG